MRFEKSVEPWEEQDLLEDVGFDPFSEEPAVTAQEQKKQKNETKESYHDEIPNYFEISG